MTTANPTLQRIDALCDRVHSRTKHWLDNVQVHVRQLEQQLAASAAREIDMRRQLDDAIRQRDACMTEIGHVREDLISASSELVRMQRMKAARARVRSAFVNIDVGGSPVTPGPFESSTDSYYAGYGGSTKWPQEALQMGSVHDSFAEKVLIKVDEVNSQLAMVDTDLSKMLVMWYDSMMTQRQIELSQVKGSGALLRESRGLLDLACQQLLKRNHDLIKRGGDQVLAQGRDHLVRSLGEMHPGGPQTIEKDLRRALAACRVVHEECVQQLGQLANTEGGIVVLERLDSFATNKTLDLLLKESLWTGEPPRDPTAPVFEGWLIKEGGNVRNWKKRWCCLMADGTLVYYKTSTDENSAGSVYLPGAMVLPAPEVDKFAFAISKVHGSSRVFKFKATNEKDLHAWLDAIKPITHNKGIGRASQRISLADGNDIDIDEWEQRRVSMGLPPSEELIAAFSASNSAYKLQTGFFHVTTSYVAFIAFGPRSKIDTSTSSKLDTSTSKSGKSVETSRNSTSAAKPAENIVLIHLCDIAKVEKATNAGLQNALRITTKKNAGAEAYFFTGFGYNKRGMAYTAIQDQMVKRVPLTLTFGVVITDIAINERSIPSAVSGLIAYLESPPIIVTEGLFRLPGSQSTVDTMQRKIDHGEKMKYDEYGPHNTAHCLKLWLRELPQPLISNYAAAIDCAGSRLTGNVTSDLPALQAMLAACSSPRVAETTLAELMRFMKAVSTHSEVNKMTPKNLATCLAPNLIRRSREEEEADPMAAISHAPLIIDVVSKLIDLHPLIWPA